MSAGNQKIVAKTSGRPDKVKVVPNWVDTDFIIPGEKENEFRKEHDLKDKFILTFAGCIADSQDMDIILSAAERLRSEQDILFLIAGNGPCYEATKQAARKLENVKILPIQPREKYVKLLAASDVALVTLNPKVATPVVPSKMLSIMAAGRPILASLPLKGDAPQVIREAGSGMVVEAGDREAFYNAVVKLYRDPALRDELGRRGRAAVVAKYSLRSCAAAYEIMFAKLNKNEKI
jgi:glycosyltransferase involved in cell wall biosynthesis